MSVLKIATITACLCFAALAMSREASAQADHAADWGGKISSCFMYPSEISSCISFHRAERPSRLMQAQSDSHRNVCKDERQQTLVSTVSELAAPDPNQDLSASKSAKQVTYGGCYCHRSTRSHRVVRQPGQIKEFIEILLQRRGRDE